MGRSSSPDCKVKIIVEEDGNKIKWREHDWRGGDVIRVYAKVTGSMKALPYWFCRECGNILDNDGNPLSRTQFSNFKDDVLADLELKKSLTWSIKKNYSEGYGFNSTMVFSDDSKPFDGPKDS